MSKYFKNYEDKYNPFLSTKKPIIVKAKINIDKDMIRLNVGNVKEIDSIVRKITKDLSRKYECVAFSSFNEINLILNDTGKIGKHRMLETHDVVSLFSQEIFMRYNELSHNQKMCFVSVNTFNLFEDKVKSYLYNRQSIGFNDYVSILSSKIFPSSQLKNKSKEDMLDVLEKITPSLKLIKKHIRYGLTVFHGQEIDICDIGSVDIEKTATTNIAICFEDSVEIEDI